MIMRNKWTKIFFAEGRAKKAATAMEYILVFFFIASAFFVFQKYLARGLSGQWRNAGDAFGHGKQFDPDATLECHYDSRVKINGVTVFTRPEYLVPCCTLETEASYPCSSPMTAAEADDICDTCGTKPTDTFNVWVETECFRDNCDCDIPEEHSLYPTLCQMCLENCRSARCNSSMCWDTAVITGGGEP